VARRWEVQAKGHENRLSMQQVEWQSKAQERPDVYKPLSDRELTPQAKEWMNRPAEERQAIVNHLRNDNKQSLLVDPNSTREYTKAERAEQKQYVDNWLGKYEREAKDNRMMTKAGRDWAETDAGEYKVANQVDADNRARLAEKQAENGITPDRGASGKDAEKGTGKEDAAKAAPGTDRDPSREQSTQQDAGRGKDAGKAADAQPEYSDTNPNFGAELKQAEQASQQRIEQQRTQKKQDDLTTGV
jgi:hypothetical protein